MRSNERELAWRVVDREDIGCRADVVLGRRLPELSRRIARRIALGGGLEIDGQRRPPSTLVALGQRLVLRLRPVAERAGDVNCADRADRADRADCALEPEEPRILRETPAVIYVDKPPGLAVHRLRPDEPLAVADWVGERFPECRGVADDPREGGAIHRLDRPTSGVVGFARSRAVWEACRRGFGVLGAVDKRYAALSQAATAAESAPWVRPRQVPRDMYSGIPGSLGEELMRLEVAGVALDPAVVAETIDAPLGRGDGRGNVAVRGDGLAARTRIQTLAEFGNRRLFLLHLLSGRRHQARVHLAAIGWPIVGDRRYRGSVGARLFLHAWSLDLAAILPAEEPVVAPLPEVFLDGLRGGD